MTRSLSIVIPAYDEEEAIRAGKLAEVAEWLSEQDFPTELVVVDDGSRDRTRELAEAMADRVIPSPHVGKAGALCLGIEVATHEVVLFTDMDLATPITESPRLLEALEAGAGVAIGSRGHARAEAPPMRRLLSRGHHVLRRLIVGLDIRDTQCGFKAFRRDVGLHVLDHLVVYAPRRQGEIEQASVNSGFDTEFLFVAQHLGYPIAEIPVEWRYQKSRRVHLWRDGYQGLRDLLAIRWSSWTRRYSQATSQPSN